MVVSMVPAAPLLPETEPLSPLDAQVGGSALVVVVEDGWVVEVDEDRAVVVVAEVVGVVVPDDDGPAEQALSTTAPNTVPATRVILRALIGHSLLSVASGGRSALQGGPPRAEGSIGVGRAADRDPPGWLSDMAELADVAG
jgi:hypothetical protein